MTIAVDQRPGHAGGTDAGRLTGLLSLGYDVAVYAILLATLLYAVGFVSGLFVPKSIDTGTVWPPFVAFCIDLQLLLLFAIQWGCMAQPSFKRLLMGYVSPKVERSIYVLCTSLTLILLFAAWQPLPALVWRAANPQAAATIQSLSFFGWLIVLYGAFLIGHFELVGARRVVLNFAGRTETAISFRTPGLYRVVRHPIYLGFMIAIWAAPVMTAGHFLFAGVMTATMLAGIWWEERDHLALFGDRYRQYQKQVAMLLPGLF
jgi:protein-S-isoprenylcysteine O-methyltransferase Ste14